MNLTLEQFEIATTLLSTEINGIAAFSFDGIDEDDSSNIHLVFENPITLEVFFRNLSINYEDNDPIDTNLFNCCRLPHTESFSRKFQKLILNISYTEDSEENDDVSEASSSISDQELSSEIEKALSRMNTCFSEVINEYIAFICEFYTSDTILAEFKVPEEQKGNFQDKLITDYFASLMVEFSHADSLVEKNSVAQKIHDLSVNMNSLKLFVQKCFPESNESAIAPYLQFGPPALNPSLIREGSGSISLGIKDISEAMPPPPARRIAARRRGIYHFYNEANAINAAYYYFKETLLSIYPKARCKLSSTVDNKINMLMPTEEAAELFRTCLGAMSCARDPISDINPKFVSVDLLKVESRSLIAFAEAVRKKRAESLIYPTNDIDDTSSKEYTAPRRMI